MQTGKGGDPTGGRRGSPKRRRNHAIRVYVDESECAEIDAKAASANLSASNYLRVLGLGHQPVSALDHQAVRELAKIAGDQGRLGGLIKQHLAAQPGEGTLEHDLATLLADVQELQAELRSKLRSL